MVRVVGPNLGTLGWIRVTKSKKFDYFLYSFVKKDEIAREEMFKTWTLKSDKGFPAMRIWCVPSATELESPKLPPRIDRDVYLRSPPPPPRLSKEEKLARGVIVLKSHSTKNRRSVRLRKNVRKASTSSSSGTNSSGHAGLCHWPEPSPFPNKPQRTTHGPPPPPPRLSPGSSGNSVGGSSPTGTSISGNAIHGSIIGTNEGLLKISSSSRRDNASVLSSRTKKNSGSSKSSPKKLANFSSSRTSINTFSCSSPFGSLPLSRDDDILSKFHGSESPAVIRHPGTSKSRDKKNKKRKKGIFFILNYFRRKKFLSSQYFKFL